MIAQDFAFGINGGSVRGNAQGQLHRAKGGLHHEAQSRALGSPGLLPCLLHSRSHSPPGKPGPLSRAAPPGQQRRARCLPEYTQ
jgi:hypothetical protein